MDKLNIYKYTGFSLNFIKFNFTVNYKILKTRSKIIVHSSNFF